MLQDTFIAYYLWRFFAFKVPQDKRKADIAFFLCKGERTNRSDTLILETCKSTDLCKY